jgi:hypothetical protein
MARNAPISNKLRSGFLETSLLSVGNRVSRPAEVDFRLGSRLMIMRATPLQSEGHPSNEHDLVVEHNGWKFLRRVRLPNDARLRDD